ncbi:MAG: hypothetical protein ACI9TI_001582 [Natronomonas sp.]|jgi:uncharacterized protein with PIN domain|uniref:Mut7-C RNAse domain-containing protein n=1 Tax=Natronomonas sp. TaxID=2184060 RepID=UPI0039890C17
MTGERGSAPDGPETPDDTETPDDDKEIRPETDRLLLDVMLGKLAVYLRVCGYDTAYALDRGLEADDRIAALAEAEGRRLLTRDVELADRVEGAVLLTERDPQAQLAELRAAGVELVPDDEPAYCGRCNGRLEPVPARADTPEYAPDTQEVDCWRCRSCEQLFWLGSHYERMKSVLTA